MIPPIVLDNIEKNGTEAQKVAVRKTIIESNKLKERRELAPIPQSHAEGEDRKVYTAKNGTTLPGTKARFEIDPDTLDQAVNEAFDGSGNTFRLYLGEYGRKSIDSNGITLVSTVHYDKDFDNAFWDGNQMVYGDGQFFNPFTRDLTVIGHELAHGVTQYTANLNYQGQSGALNEHISDVFGALVEQYAYMQDASQATWLIGALLCQGKIQGRALRDMLNPGTAYDDPIIGKDPQGADMSHYDNTSQDNGGVHINSGIPNRAFALASQALGGFAWEKTGQIWYSTLVYKVKSTTQFHEFAKMTFVTAEEMFGKGSKEQLAVQNGWNSVEIDVLKTEPEPQPIPESPCSPFILNVLKDKKAVQFFQLLIQRQSVRELFCQLGIKW